MLAIGLMDVLPESLLAPVALRASSVTPLPSKQGGYLLAIGLMDVLPESLLAPVALRGSSVTPLPERKGGE